MRRFLLAGLTAAMLVGSALPAAANPTQPQNPTLPTDLTYKATDNVEYLGRFPEHAGTAGGIGSEDGKLFYVTDPRAVAVYDTTNPAAPKLLDSLPLYQHASGTGAALGQEDPDTNGKILLVDGSPVPNSASSTLQIVDVSNPSDLKVLSSVPSTTDHTWTCVSGTDATGATNSCSYAYGRTGTIVDLRDPAAPKKLSTNWKTVTKVTAYTHDLTEIRPGLLMTAGAVNVLMDTRNPAAPVKLTAIDKKDHGHAFAALGYHSLEWGNNGFDRFLVAGTEIGPQPGAAGMAFGSDCKGSESVIETWDASQILEGLTAYFDQGVPAAEAFADRKFIRVDSYDAASRGIFLQGQAPGNVMYCAHWMELHPGFDGGGLVTVSYYDRGTRFLKVGADGVMSEVGWITAAEGYSGSSQWVTGDYVYIMDYRRGMEVVKLKGTPATGVTGATPAAIAVGPGFVPPSALSRIDGNQASALALALFGLLLVRVKRKDRRSRRDAA